MFASLVLNQLIALSLTILIETPVMFCGFFKERKAIGTGYLLLYCVLINSITNISINTIINIFRWLLHPSVVIYWVVVAVLEILVAVSEICLFKMAVSKYVGMLKISVTVIVANIVSFGMGLLIF